MVAKKGDNDIELEDESPQVGRLSFGYWGRANYCYK